MSDYFDRYIYFQDSWPKDGFHVPDLQIPQVGNLYEQYELKKIFSTQEDNPAHFSIPDYSQGYTKYPSLSGSEYDKEFPEIGLKFKKSFLRDITDSRMFHLGGHYITRKINGKLLPQILVGSTCVITPEDIANCIIANSRDLVIGIFSGYKTLLFVKALVNIIKDSTSKSYIFLFTPHVLFSANEDEFKNIAVQGNGTLKEKWEGGSLLVDQEFLTGLCNDLSKAERDQRDPVASATYAINQDTKAETKISFLLEYDRSFSTFDYITSAELLTQEATQ